MFVTRHVGQYTSSRYTSIPPPSQRLQWEAALGTCGHPAFHSPRERSTVSIMGREPQQGLGILPHTSDPAPLTADVARAHGEAGPLSPLSYQEERASATACGLTSQDSGDLGGWAN